MQVIGDMENLARTGFGDCRPVRGLHSEAEENRIFIYGAAEIQTQKRSANTT